MSEYETVRSHQIGCFKFATDASLLRYAWTMSDEVVKKGEMTRRRIVALAAPVFNQKGFAGTALSDLMEATGLEKGGIYRHFDSKQQLAEDAFDFAWATAIEARFTGIDEIPNAVDRLKQFVANFRERRAGLVAGGCPLLNTAVEADDGNPQLRARVRQALNSWLGRLESIIQQGRQRGDILPSVDAKQLATLIVSTLEGALILSRIQRTSDPLDAACTHLSQHLEKSVRTKKRS
jgi:TetR/AcrR family transcriptional regulator, transcriptional repressor for nem operon